MFLLCSYDEYLHLTTSRKLDCFLRKNGETELKNQTSENIQENTKSFAKYNCINSNCICQLLKHEATKNVYIHSCGCLYQRGNQKLQFTQKLSIYHSAPTKKCTSLPLDLLSLNICVSVVNALQDIKI